jgi:hypothetical protein
MSKLSNDENALSWIFSVPRQCHKTASHSFEWDELGHCSASPQPLVTRQLPTCTKGWTRRGWKTWYNLFGGQFWSSHFHMSKRHLVLRCLTLINVDVTSIKCFLETWCVTIIWGSSLLYTCVSTSLISCLYVLCAILFGEHLLYNA